MIEPINNNSTYKSPTRRSPIQLKSPMRSRSPIRTPRPFRLNIESSNEPYGTQNDEILQEQDNERISNYKIKRDFIRNEIIPSLMKEIRSMIYWRQKWKTISSILFAITFFIGSTITILGFTNDNTNKDNHINKSIGYLGIYLLINDRLAHYCISKHIENSKNITKSLLSIENGQMYTLHDHK